MKDVKAKAYHARKMRKEIGSEGMKDSKAGAHRAIEKRMKVVTEARKQIGPNGKTRTASRTARKTRTSKRSFAFGHRHRHPVPHAQRLAL